MSPVRLRSASTQARWHNAEAKALDDPVRSVLALTGVAHRAASGDLRSV